MAVKLMVATAIAKGELEKPDRAAARPAAPAKPKRRRSSVYDADGNEVFITLMCLKCHKMRPLAQFGLRKMADGAIRNQPWCRSCRGAAGEKPRRPAAPPAEGFAAEAPSTAGEPDSATEASRRTGSVAAEVAAALAGGRR
jgi:hypothetical protein